MKLKRIFIKMFYFVILSVVVFIVAITLIVNYYPAFGDSYSGESISRLNTSLHFKTGKFTNLYKTKEKFGWNDYIKFFRKIVRGNPKRTPSQSLPMHRWTKEQISNIADSATLAIWCGHSTFFIKINGKNILIDPMFGKYPSPLPYLVNKRFNDTLPVSVEDLPHIDIVILSHDHYDHLDYNSIVKLKDKTNMFLTPLGVGAHLLKWGVDSKKIVELDWYDEFKTENLKFACTPAQHFSGRGIRDKMKTLWCSWVIEGKHKIFFSGDSGYFKEFKTIGKKYGPFDVCLLECGQYDELWRDIHMFPEETAQAHIDLKGDVLIPIHWGAFGLGLHNWDEPIRQLSKACKARKIYLETPEIGDEILIGQKQKFFDWWKNIK